MDEDLYGDLDTSTSALVKTEALQQKQRVESENEKLRKELAVLQHENRELGERNKALETNISSLFVTAQHELKRKDAEIQRLRDELERGRKPDRGNSAPRHSHSQDPLRHDRDRDRDSAHSRSTSSYAPPDIGNTHRRAPAPPPPRPTSRER